MQHKPIGNPEQDWKEVPRSQMFSRIMVALDFARSVAVERGDARRAHIVEEQLFPFIEKEMFNAEVDEAAKKELEAALGVKQIAELSPEKYARGWRLVRTCDAFGLMRMALQGDTILDGEDKENALAELRILEEDAENQLRSFQREHGIPV
jgi:hypothetical protein